MKPLKIVRGNGKSEVATIDINNQATIKAYFAKVFELHKGGELFSVDLEDIWALCYSRKDKAVKALLENYIEDDDYIVIPLKGENLKGGRPTQVYKLSTPCFEHFIARKVKAVFEVYRQFFHTATAKPQLPQLSQIDLIIQSAIAINEQQARTEVLEQKVMILEAKTTTRPEYFTVCGFAIMNKINIGLQMAARVGSKAKAMCKNQGITVESIPDPRFGKVGMYPKIILEQAFTAVRN